MIRLVAVLLGLAAGVSSSAAQPATRPATGEVTAAFRDRPQVKSRLETEWDGAAKAAYARARELAECAPAGVR